MLPGRGWALVLSGFACAATLLFWLFPQLLLIDTRTFVAGSYPPPAVACRAPDETESRRDELALELLRTWRPDDPGSSLRDATIRHFASRSGFRRGDRIPVCLPEPLKDAIAEAAVAAGLFAGPFLEPDLLRLAQQLGPRDPSIAAAVTRTAFETSGIFHVGGVRPSAAARVVLAGFCGTDPALAARAFEEANIMTPGGRAATLLAAACGSEEALAFASAGMSRLLRGEHGAISLASGDALRELAIALQAGGERSQPYAAPIRAMLDRLLMSQAPPYGMIRVPPSRLCAVAAAIGGEVAEAARAKPFCQQDRSRL